MQLKPSTQSIKSLYKTFVFELELQSGKIVTHNTQARTSKEAWMRIGNYVNYELDEDDPVINIGHSATTMDP